MPVAVHITPSKMSREDYDRVMGVLTTSGAGEPEGRLYHAGYGEDEVHMFEVWESQEHFDAHSDRLLAALQGVGAGGSIVQVHPLHSPHPD